MACDIMHVIDVELYLKLKPAEGERHRIVSFEKQLKAGFRHPGSASLVIECWGNAAPCNLLS